MPHRTPTERTPYTEGQDIRMRELFETRLGTEHAATGFTRHTSNGDDLPAPYWLRIVEYEDGPGFYLLYLAENLDEQTDTWHSSVEDAMEQARLEFGISTHDWIKIKQN